MVILVLVCLVHSWEVWVLICCNWEEGRVMNALMITSLAATAIALVSTTVIHAVVWFY